MGGPSPKSFGDLRKLFLRLFELVCDDKKNEKPEVVRFAFLRLRKLSINAAPYDFSMIRNARKKIFQKCEQNAICFFLRRCENLQTDRPMVNSVLGLVQIFEKKVKFEINERVCEV